MTPVQRRRLLGRLVLTFAATLAGCGAEKPTTPPLPTPLAVSLAVTPASGPVSTLFRPFATVTGVEPESLSTLRYQWDFDDDGSWDTDWNPEPDADVMYRTVGPERIRVGVRDGKERVATGDALIVVTGGTEDGSLEFIEVPQGSFTRGSDPDEGSFGDQRPEVVLDIGAFEIGRTEVTAAAFVEAMNWASQRGRVQVVDTYLVIAASGGTLILDILRSPVGLDGIGGFAVKSGRDLEPVTGITWFGAVLWCNWRSEMDGLVPCYDPATFICDFEQNGYRLPTEAEWEKSARGGHELAPGMSNPLPEREYPWGDASPDCEHANYAECVLGSAPVGSYPLGRSPYGLDDLSGNALEWCQDWYEYDYYSVATTTDPHGPASSTTNERVQRGGSWDAPFAHLASCSVRLHDRHGSATQLVGFRVVRRA